MSTPRSNYGKSLKTNGTQQIIRQQSCTPFTWRTGQFVFPVTVLICMHDVE